MKTVLFICVHNSGRSQMAEAYFNRMAKGKARAFSAGSHPDDKVNPSVVKVMLEEGFDLSGNIPRMLTPEMMAGTDRAITMGCENSCPFTTVPTVDWGLEDPKNKTIEQIRIIRDQIKTRVSALIDEFVTG
ncbi:MAG TPA: arsenate reductase ArsC [Dehalococcoidales bacterium]|nr:arsenate reductase ArsC [Dehalococcoidales bacterium]